MTLAVSEYPRGVASSLPRTGDIGGALTRLVAALHERGYKTKQAGPERYRAQCPAHDGTGLNLSVAAGDQGVLVHCFSHDCSEADIAAAVGLEVHDLFDKDGRAVYDYGNGYKLERRRKPRKGASGSQKIVKPVGAGITPKVRPLWVPPGSRPLAGSSVVFLAEGEKAADALVRLGASCAASWSGGTSGARYADLSVLEGKAVVLVPDNDEAGQKVVPVLVGKLDGVAADVTVARTPYGLNDPADLLLHGDMDHSVDDLEAVEVPSGERARSEPGEVVRSVSVMSAASIRSRRQEWLWADRIPLGTVCLFSGRGGEGKSSFALHLASQLNRGVLEGDLYGTPVSAVIVSLEDDWGAVMKPRLVAAGADLEAVYRVTVDATVNDATHETSMTLPLDTGLIGDAIDQTGAKVVILDPATSLMEGNLNRREDARQSLDALLQLAQDKAVSIVLISHMSKGQGNVSDKISGSHALRDAVRSVLLFATEPDTGNRVITVDKNNYSGNVGESLAFALVDTQVTTDDGQTTHVARVESLGASDVSVSDIINHGPDDDADDRNAAQAFVIDYLKNAEALEAPAGDVIKAGRAAGFNENEIKHARRRCRDPRIASRKSGFGAGWVWALDHEGATEGAEGVKDSISGTLGTFVAPSTGVRS